MKKAVIALLLAFDAGAPNAQSMLILHENQAGAICYRAPLGATFQVSLPAQAGTGYSWRVTSGEGLEQVGDPVIGQPAGGGMVLGGPEIQTVRLRATLPGRHTLTVALARGQDRNVAPVRTLSFCLATPER